MDPHNSPGEVIHHVVAGTSKVVLDILGGRPSTPESGNRLMPVSDLAASFAAWC